MEQSGKNTENTEKLSTAPRVDNPKNQPPGTAPTAPKCKVDELPDTLQRDGKFCCWKYIWKDKRWTKKPVDPRSNGDGDSTDPAKFAGLPTAEGCMNHFPNYGLGLGIFNNIGAIDIDDCRDDTGKMSDFALYVVDLMDHCYIEISPSGRGIRLLFTVPDGFTYDKKRYYIRNPYQKIEVYVPGMTNRFVTLTGNTVTPGRDLEDRGEQLRKVVENCMERRTVSKNIMQTPPTPLNMSDTALLARIDGSNDQKLKDLMAGNWEKYPEYPSESEADLGLCIKLCFWTHGDPDQIERLFCESGLCDEKWQRREDYRRDTIARAIEKNGGNYWDPDYKKNQDKDAADHQEPAPTVDNPQEPPEDETPETPADESPQDQEPDALDNFLNEIYTTRFEPIPTGIEAIDDLLSGGIISQVLVILSAPPAAGKTALACEIFENFARFGRKCVYLNLEMSQEQIFARSISKQIYIDHGLKFSSLYILQGYRQTPDDKAIIKDAVEKYRANIYPNLKYNPKNVSANLTDIIEYMNDAGKAAKKRGEPGPIFAVDYLHLLEGDLREDPAEMLKRATIEFKKYAITYNTIVFAISAQSRAANKSREAKMESGRDTSALEYSADYLLQITDTDGKEKENGIINLCVTKNRFGRSDPDDPAKLKFIPAQSYFTQPESWEIEHKDKHKDKKNSDRL